MIDAIRTSSSASSGRRSSQRRRETFAWSCDTPFANAAWRSARTAIEKGSPVAFRHLAAELHEVLDRDAAVPRDAGEVPLDERQREPVDPGGYGRVGREDRPRRRRVARLREREPFGGDELADPLEDDEGGVPLVDVPDRRRDPEPPERAQPADAERDLLADAHLLVAGVEPRRHRAILRVILGQVRVEEEKRNAPDAREADEKLDGAVPELEGDGRRPAVGRRSAARAAVPRDRAVGSPRAASRPPSSRWRKYPSR